ncbi:hypothetical protein [Nodularia sp. UHCC 0506]|uniref:hypothetical protein n=1 Tax=Nodularia sp. UHCC 0506 TaxID=3110243 RepID=UPI002B2185FB|nr:hypothetical protein [Nodularia sp. UHCC 0506]MEA5515087.1 hypothetical protein [Nodularia sp. UHCC 0506]
MNKFIIGLFTVSAIAFASSPAHARPHHVDNAQIINQENIITGDGNTSVNRATQVHQNVRTNSRRGGSSSSGQVTNQRCDTVGFYNRCINNASQSNQQIEQGHQQRNFHRGRFNRH